MTENRLIFWGVLFLILLKLFLSNRFYIEAFSLEYNRYIIAGFFINILVYRYLVKIVLLKTLYQESIAKIEKHIASLYYILLVGSIGTRKSANLTAFTQMCEMAKIRQMEEKQYKIRALFNKYVDFKDFDMYINDKLDKDTVYHDLLYKYFVYKYFKNLGQLDFLITRFDFESFRDPKVLEIMAEYVEVYYYLNYRKNHILSNTTIQSINTGLNSLPVKESYWQLYRKNTLASEKYLVTVEDEKGVVDNSRVYARMDKKSVEDNDDGKDIHAMLQRHGSKGTNTNLVVAQSEKDVTANRRRLPNRFVEFLTPNDSYIFNFEKAFLEYRIAKNRRKEMKKFNKKMRKVQRLTKLYSAFKRKRHINKAEKIYLKYHDFLDRNNKFKKRIGRLEKWNISLGKHLYLIQYMFLHKSEEKIGQSKDSERVITESFPLTIVYPASITYNRYDQYAFYDVFNERNKAATTPLAKLNPFKHKIMTREEHEKMDYKAINRIFDELDSQMKTPKKVKPTSSKPQKPQTKPNYDVF